MNVLSLFNGMGFGAMALESLNIKVDKYYSSEIDKYSNKAANALYPDTIQLGDITKWREWDIDWSSIDLLIGGSPCQGFSFAGKQLAFDDPRSKLFFCFVEILSFINSSSCKPVKFMLENVKMKKEYSNIISGFLNVNHVLINSELLSGQDRKRNYWSNSKIDIPQFKSKLVASDFIDHSYQKPNSESWQKWWLKNGEFQLKKKYSCILNDIDKAITQTARQISSWNGCLVRNKDGSLRFFTPREAARLQGMKEHKIDILINLGISNTQLYKMLGNGWQLDTIVHIFKGMDL